MGGDTRVMSSSPPTTAPCASLSGVYYIGQGFWLFVDHCAHDFHLEAPGGFTASGLRQALTELKRRNLAMVELGDDDMYDIDTAVADGRGVLIPLEHIDVDQCEVGPICEGCTGFDG